jgi:hypothetical protein
MACCPRALATCFEPLAGRDVEREFECEVECEVEREVLLFFDDDALPEDEAR